MSIISIAGTLVLSGDILTDGQVRVESNGILIPQPVGLSDAIYSCPKKDFIFQNGKSPTITSTLNGSVPVIQILGTVDGVGQGFSANSGPGANSSLPDNAGDPSDIYGATHAGIGTVHNIPGIVEVIEESYTINLVNMSMGGIKLAYQPIGSQIAVNIVNGPSQVPGVDFVMQGDFLSWLSKGLETLIDIGDVLRVFYIADTSRYFGAPKKPYGSYEAPTSIGSGSGEAGGGSGLKLVARNGTINLNGTVNLSGGDGLSTRSGGGSGGSFWATSYKLTGSGSIVANGGDASYSYAGGGGGGYVALNYEYENTFQGACSVNGKKGGTNGVVTIKKIEPFFIEKFTGTYLNPKWWVVTNEPVAVNNFIQMDTTTSDFRNPQLESLFNISGSKIQVECDYIPSGIEPAYHTSYFRLFKDDRNWVQVAKKHGNIFGMYTVDGFLSQTAVPYDYTNATFSILKSDSTYTFQVLDSSNGPTTIFSESIPELNYEEFKVAFGTQKGEPDASNYMVDYFRLTNVDDANGFVTLSGIPLDSSSVALNVVGGGPQIYGVDYTVSGQDLYWFPASLNLHENDELTVSYSNDATFNDLHVSWDNFKVYAGILTNVESSEATLYVDPINGSDANQGTVLSPLASLPIATAWAKKGSTVVLYDGTFNPAEVINKNLTICGANGASPLITTLNVQDTTGSNWENAGLTFRNCQGLVKNINFSDSTTAIFGEGTINFEVNNCSVSNTTTAIKIVEYNKDCRIIGNNIKDTSEGVVVEGQSFSPVIYSNLIYDTSVAIVLNDVTNCAVSSNTLDHVGIGLLTDQSSYAAFASNSITNSGVGVQLNGDTSVVLSSNNFWGTANWSAGTGTVVKSLGNINSQPGYVNIALRNYHLLSFSANRNSGTGEFDPFYMDKDGASRTKGIDIGCYQYLSNTHLIGPYYLDSSGDDFYNTGNVNSPYRTLDKAMAVADYPVYLSPGFNMDSSGNALVVGDHLDSKVLNLRGQGVYFVDSSNIVQTVTLDSNYSNINLGNMLFISPNGYDSTGITGSLSDPYRTIGRALEDSSVGTCIIALSGDYPLFTGLTGRVLVPFGDRTGIADGTRMSFEDVFATPSTMFPGHTAKDESSWIFSFT